MRSGLLLIFLSFILFSCQKDRPVALEGASGIQATPSSDGEYNRVGGDLEEAFSFAIQDPAFKLLITVMTQTKEDGDYEVLLSDLMAVQMKTGGTALDYFMTLVNRTVSQQDVQSFMAANPAMIVAVRGNPANWLRGTYVPPVKFVPRGFSEQTKTTTATQNGSPVALDLSSQFTEAVIVIMKSERHDDNGVFVTSLDDKPRGGRQFNPGIGATDVTGPTQLRVTCDPEPTACPGTDPVLTSFTATPENGAIKLSYNFSNLPPTFCTWGRIKITRLNPNNSTTEFYRWANQATSFYDNSGSPGINYSYTAVAYVAYIDNATGNWVTCPANPVQQNASAQYPAFGSPMDSYTGSNQTSTSIRYDWLPPTSGAANEYRIRRATPNNYVNLVSGLPGTQTDYFYSPVPSSFRGTLIETQIQYRAAGPWQGNFFDRTYASFRNPGQPLYFHGVRMDLAAFEFSESPLFGSPEIRITALQANAAEQTTTPAQTFLPMTGCQQTIQTEQIAWNFFPFNDFPFIFPPLFPFPWGGPTIITVEYNVNNGYYYPTEAPNGYPILDIWNSDLYSSAIKVTLKETDINVPIVTGQTNTSSTETTVKADFGFKLFKVIGADIGVESTWKDATTTTIRYPDSDLDIEVDRIIYYHEPLVLPKGRALFSNQEFSNQCAALQNNL